MIKMHKDGSLLVMRKITIPPSEVTDKYIKHRKKPVPWMCRSQLITAMLFIMITTALLYGSLTQFTGITISVGLTLAWFALCMVKFVNSFTLKQNAIQDYYNQLRELSRSVLAIAMNYCDTNHKNQYQTQLNELGKRYNHLRSIVDDKSLEAHDKACGGDSVVKNVFYHNVVQ